MNTFGQVLESADQLPLDEQESLVSVLQRRVAEQRRAELVDLVKDARREFKEGKCRPSSAGQIIKNLLS